MKKDLFNFEKMVFPVLINGLGVGVFKNHATKEIQISVFKYSSGKKKAFKIFETESQVEDFLEGFLEDNTLGKIEITSNIINYLLDFGIKKLK